MCKNILLSVLLFFWPLFLFAESLPDFITMTDIQVYGTQSKPQTPGNYSENLTQLQQNSDKQNPPLLNPNNPWEDLKNWIDKGMKGLDESAESLTRLENQLTELKAENKAQESLLKQSQELLTYLKTKITEAQNNVDVAIDRMQDAEGYAQFVDAQNILLKKEAARYKKSAPIGFVFGGVSFGVGTPLIVEGIRADNSAMLWSGVGVTAAGSLVWVLGHFVFCWW